MTQSNKLIAAKRVAIAVAAVCASLSAPVYANDSKALLDLMLKKGVITQKDYDEFVESTKDAAENKAFKEQRIDQDVSKAVKFMQKNADNGSVMKNGFGVRSADGKNTMALTGRVHFDARQFQEGPYQDRMEVRRARFGVRGQIAGDFKYEIVGDFGASANSSGIASGDDVGMSNRFTGTDVAYVDYAGFQPMQVRVGRFKMPFSLEQLTSSNNIDTIERSLMGQFEGEFVPAKETGAMVFGSPVSGFTYALATSRGRSNVDVNTASKGDLIGRVTANVAELTGNKDYIGHLGFAYSDGEVKSGTAITSARTEAREEDKFFTGASTTSLATRNRQGIEGAFAYSAFKLQGELFNVKYDDSAATDKEVKGHYIQGVWNLTGETHNYSNSSGTFGGLKVKSPFTLNGGTGAWQLVVRHSELDGSGAGAIAAGKTSGAKAWTYGVNWVLNENARVMLNYIKTDFNTAVTNSGQSLRGQEAIVLRGQLSF